MNQLKIKYLLIGLVCFGLLWVLVVAFENNETAKKKSVTQTATDGDKNSPFNSLKSPANDIQLIKGVWFGFQQGNFTILQHAEATHMGIESAFMILIQMVQPGDFVYIHYSGHGSQTADLNGDEISGKDQTWVGARTAHKDNYDVLDDEINAWLAALYAKTDQVVFVSDSCHWATVSKAFELARADRFWANMPAGGLAWVRRKTMSRLLKNGETTANIMVRSVGIGHIICNKHKPVILGTMFIGTLMPKYRAAVRQ